MSAAISASSSTTPPRAVFTTIAPLGSLAMRSALTHLRVAGVIGALIDRKSQCGSMASGSAWKDRALFEVGRQAAAVAVVDLHAEGPGPVGHGLADAAHAEDAQPLAGDVHAHELGRRPAHPVVGPQHGRALVGAPRGAQQAEHGDVGGGVGQHVGRVADRDAALGGRGDVDMLVADREGGDHADRGRQAGDGLGVQGIAGGAHDAVAAGRRLDQGGAVIEPVLGVEHGVEIGRQPGLDVGREVPGGENPRFAGRHKRYPPCAALPQAIILVIRAHGYYAWPPGYKA